MVQPCRLPSSSYSHGILHCNCSPQRGSAIPICCHGQNPQKNTLRTCINIYVLGTCIEKLLSWDKGSRWNFQSPLTWITAPRTFGANAAWIGTPWRSWVKDATTWGQQVMDYEGSERFRAWLGLKKNQQLGWTSGWLKEGTQSRKSHG